MGNTTNKKKTSTRAINAYRTQQQGRNMVKAGQIFMSVSAFCFGLSYDFMVFFFAVVLLIFLMVLCLKQGEIVLQTGKCMTALFVFCASNFIAIFTGVETGISVIGFLRVLVIPIWVCILTQFSLEERNDLLKGIPYSGVIMTIICTVCYLIPEAKGWFFSADRMGGFFQYSNTFAFFLLVGIILLSNQYRDDNQIQTVKYCLMVMVLLLGILWSGSRSVFLFAILIFVILAVWDRKKRYLLLGIMGLGIIVGLLYVGITGNTDSIGRFTETSILASTFLGRVLYSIDAIPLLLKNPFGLGYMGYYFMQPQVQHGVYQVRYVHNDWLQLGLDGGIIALLAFVFLMGCNIVKQRKISRNNVLVLLLFSFQMLMEFHLTFYSMVICLLTCMDWSGVEKRLPIKGMSFVFFCGSVLVYFWLFLATAFDYLGKESISFALYPWNSEVETKVMLQCSDSESAEPYAEHILEKNEYSYAAYNVKAVAALDKGNYMEMLQYKQKALNITRYTLEEYEDYVLMLKIAIEGYTEQGNMQYRQQCVEYLLQVEDMLREVEETTNPLAYKIDDIPNLELPEEYQIYIQSFK